jgi:hypothetical protein
MAAAEEPITGSCGFYEVREEILMGTRFRKIVQVAKIRESRRFC